MWKSSKQQWPDGELDDRLSELLRAAAAAGIKQRDIAELLERHAASIHRCAAVNANLNDTPKIRSGNIPDNMGGRLAKMIRG